jgi:hypothetical protein
MVKKTVVPATISLRAVTPWAFSAKRRSSIGSPFRKGRPPRAKKKAGEGSGLAFLNCRLSPNLAALADLVVLFMGYVDNGSGGGSHAIIRRIATQ